MTRLAALSLLLLATLVAHTLDHALNQPVRDGPASGTAIGIAGFAIVAAASVLALRRSPHAAAASVFAGAITAFGIVAVHLLPGWWGFVSDPYWDFEANALTWVLAMAPLAVGLALAVAGARRMSGLEPSGP
jgi:hypothetical protein